MTEIPYRVGLIQRVLPNYRAPFFDTLAEACQNGLGVFAGQPRQEESIETAKGLAKAVLAPANNLHLLRGPFYLCYQRGIIHWLENWQPDILIVEANPRYLSTPAAIRWMRSRNRPIIGWGLGAPSVSGVLASLREKSRQRFLAQFDTLLTYSQRGAEEYAQTGFNPQHIFVAPNAVAPRPTRPAQQRPERPSGKKPVVIFVGRLQSRKRVDLLLRACAALPQEKQPELWIIGDGPARPEFEQIARSVYPEAKFLGGKHGAELAPFLEQADLFVLPGTGGLAIQQAMSFALPVIVAEGDGTQSNLVRPENGWNLTTGSLEELTRTIEQALSDIPGLRRMGAASYKIVAEEINLEGMVAAFSAAIQTAAAKQSR